MFTSSGTNNTVGTCSATNASGVSTCTLKSTKAEVKTPQISSPIVKAGSTITFVPGAPSAATTTIAGTTPTLANGTDVCGITITIRDANSNPISGTLPTYSMTGTSNTTNACSTSDSSGVSLCSATSTKAEEKIFNLLTPVAVASTPVDFNPNGINIQVPIEMIDRGLSSSTAAITFNRTRTSLEPSAYVAQINTYMFEVIAMNTNTTTAYTIYLVDNAGVQITTSAITVPANTTTSKRFNVLWTPNSATDNYRIKVPATAVAGQVKIDSAKMIVEQTAAVATKIYIPLAGGDNTGENASDANGTTAHITSVTATAFAAPTTTTESYYILWTRTDASYDAIASGTPWTLETVSSTSNVAGIATAALFDRVNNLELAGANTAVTGSTALTFRQTSFAGNATNFNDGDTLQLRLKSNNTLYTTRIYKAGLWLKLKYLKKGEFYVRLLNRRILTTTLSLPDARYLWDAGAWSNPTVYFETNNRLGTTSVSLLNHSTNDTGITAPTTVAGSTITPTATYSIQRSGLLTLIDMNRYMINHKRSSGTPSLGGAFLVIKATE